MTGWKRRARALERIELAIADPHEPCGGHQDQLVDAARMADRGLGGDEAAHRVADERRPLDADRPEERVDESPVARDPDLLVRQLRLAEPARSSAITRWLRASWGMFSSQFCQHPDRPWTKDDRRPLAHLDVVDARRRAARGSGGAAASRCRATPNARRRRSRRARCRGRGKLRSSVPVVAVISTLTPPPLCVSHPLEHRNLVDLGRLQMIPEDAGRPLEGALDLDRGAGRGDQVDRDVVRRHGQVLRRIWIG